MAERLRARHGSGFGYAWRNDLHRVINPSWVTLATAAFAHDTGFVVGGGIPTHDRLGLSPAYDMGAIDGSNMSAFPSQGHNEGLILPARWLWVGSARSGSFVPLDVSVSVISVDLHPASRRIAVLSHLGNSVFALWMYDEFGEKTLLTVLEPLAGAEPVRFSSDGTWLLVTAHDRSIIVECSTGRRCEVPVGNAGRWSPDNSALLTVRNQDGAATPQVFDLKSNAITRESDPVRFDAGDSGIDAMLWNPAVSADGREILALTAAGVPEGFRSDHGSGQRVARVALEDGRGVLLRDAFIAGETAWERDAWEARWSMPAAPTTVELGASVTDGLRAPVREHDMLSESPDSMNLERTLVPLLNRAIDLTKAGESCAHYVPEIIALIHSLSRDAETWGKQQDWLLGLVESTSTLAHDGSMDAASAQGWKRINAAIEDVAAGRSGEMSRVFEALWV